MLNLPRASSSPSVYLDSKFGDVVVGEGERCCCCALLLLVVGVDAGLVIGDKMRDSEGGPGSLLVVPSP